MVVKLASLKVSTKTEMEGEWIEIGEWPGLIKDRPWEIVKLPGLKFKVRSINDPAYRIARQKAFEQLEKRRKDYPDETVPDDVTATVEGRIIAENLLLGWEGLDEEYSPDLARKQLEDPDCRPLRELVTACAVRVGKRDVEFVKDLEKN